MRWGRPTSLKFFGCSLITVAAAWANAQDRSSLDSINHSGHEPDRTASDRLDPAQFVDCPPLTASPESTTPIIQPYALGSGAELPGSAWSPTIKPHDPRTIARQAATITLASVIDDPNNPNPVRRAVIRLVTPEPASAATPPVAPSSPATAAPSGPSAQPSAGAILDQPTSQASSPALTPASSDSAPRVAEREPSTDSTSSVERDSDSSGQAEATVAEPESEYRVEVLPIDPRLRTQTPSFRLTLQCLKLAPEQRAELVLQIEGETIVRAIKPNDGWTKRSRANEWVWSLNSITVGDELDWIVELPAGVEECSVEARVDLIDDESSSESASDSIATEEDATPLPTDDSSETTVESNDEVVAEDTPATESVADAADAAPLRPAPSPISRSSQRNERSISDEPQVLAPRTRGVELKCEGPTTTLLGASVIYELQVSNRSSETLSDLELTTDLPEGIFLEGRRRVLLSEELAPGQDATIEVALRAHAPGTHQLKFVLVNDGLTVASVQHELEVLERSMQVELLGPESFEAGNEATFSVEIAYHGEEPVSDVVITLQLDASLRVTTLEHAAGFDAERQLLAWRIVELKPGDEVQLRYKVVSDRAGPVEQQVGVSAPALSEPIHRELAGTVVARASSPSREQELRGARRSLSAPPVPTPGRTRSMTGPASSPTGPPPVPRTASNPQSSAAPARQPDPNGRVPLRDPPRVPR